MQIAIVGLAGSGKTTVFNTLTRGHAETGGFGGVELFADNLRRFAAGEPLLNVVDPRQGY